MLVSWHGPLTRYVNVRVAHAPGMPGTFFPRHRLQRKPLVCDPSRHASRHVRHARAVMHVGIANLQWAGKTFPAFPAHAQPTILRISQEAMETVSALLSLRGEYQSQRGGLMFPLLLDENAFGQTVELLVIWGTIALMCCHWNVAKYKHVSSSFLVVNIYFECIYIYILVCFFKAAPL